MIHEKPDTTANVLEPVIFTSISELNVLNSKVSQMNDIVKYISFRDNLPYNTKKGFDKIKEQIINAVKNN